MYYRCIRLCPLSLILSVFSLCFGLFIVAIYQNDLPSFEDPLVGFEVRNSELSKRLNTWRLLIESTSWNGLLSLYPKLFDFKENNNINKTVKSSSRNVTKKLKHHKSKKKNKIKKENEDSSQFDVFTSKSHMINESRYFCGPIFEEYVHFVIESTDGRNLLELSSLRNACQLDRTILRMEQISYNQSNSLESHLENDSYHFHFGHYCEKTNTGQSCCPSWSVANFVLAFANKTDCDDLTELDIDSFVSRLNLCAEFYADHYLNAECDSDPSQCPNVPQRCYSHNNLVYNVFNFLVDFRFLSMNRKILNSNETVVTPKSNFTDLSEIITISNRPFLTSSSIFLPMAKSSKLMRYFESITTTQNHKSRFDLSFGNVQIVAADLGLKHTLFNQSLVSDLVLAVFASFTIFCSLFLYTRSILLTGVTLLTNLASLGSAYFIYCCFFQISFFPFLNLLSIIVLIGIGSDNALIYCKAWCCVMATLQIAPTSSTTTSKTLNRRNDYHSQMAKAFNHVLISSFCASLTTCGAFFVGYFSDITSLKCFSIFAGTAIITNFVITIITFPSAIVLSDKMSATYSLVIGRLFRNTPNKLNYITNRLSQFVFETIILKLVFNCRYLLVVLLSLVALGSSVVIFYSPGLQLPKNLEFQIFSSNHIFERFDFQYKNVFWFSRIDKTSGSVNTGNIPPSQISGAKPAFVPPKFVLPIRVVFGILPSDNGDFLNPFDRGKLEFDSNFNISLPESQLWLLDFCRELRTQPFYQPTIGPLLTNCFIETFKSWMEDRRCNENVGNEFVDRYPCCKLSKFPYEPQVFDRCLVEVIDRLHRTPNYMFHMNRAGPRFDLSANATVKAIVIEYDSSFDALANSYQEMDLLWHQIDGWIRQQLKDAPKGLDTGWFITSNVEFFALQQSLSTGATKSLIIAVVFAFCTLIFTTWNLRLSILSTISISFVIFTTIASLVLLGWRLNIIESITISLTIGLAIDATLHYTIAYKLLTKGNKLLGIQMTIARIGSPVAMGALTTFLAGAVMLFSYILAYIQIGTFLMLLSVISWAYSTLFHLSLLSIFGSHHEDSSFLLIDYLVRFFNQCCPSSHYCGNGHSITPGATPVASIPDSQLSNDDPLKQKSTNLATIKSLNENNDSTNDLFQNTLPLNKAIVDKSINNSPVDDNPKLNELASSLPPPTHTSLSSSFSNVQQSYCCRVTSI